MTAMTMYLVLLASLVTVLLVKRIVVGMDLAK